MDLQNKQTRKLLTFLESRPGFEILQTNGQRRFGIAVDTAGFYPPKGSEVFVGKLPRNMFEDELVPIFEKVGTIFEIRMMMDFSGTNRGFCFVKFTNPQEADSAVRQLNNFEVRPGKIIGVVKSVDNCRLFFGGLPKDKTEQDFHNELVKYVDDVRHIIMYRSVEDKTKNRGYAFVEFSNHRAAAMARRRLVPNRVLFWGIYLQIDWAVPEHEVDREIMSKVKILFLRNVLLSTSEETIRNAMNMASPNSVTRVKKMKDFAFVHFSTREHAENAMNYWNGKEIDGSVIEITWAKPAQKLDKWKRIFEAQGADLVEGGTFQQPLVNNYNGQGNFLENPWTYNNQAMALLPPVPIFSSQPSIDQQEAASATVVVPQQDMTIQGRENMTMLPYFSQNQQPMYTNGNLPATCNLPAQTSYAPVMGQGEEAACYPYLGQIGYLPGYQQHLQ